MGGNFLEVVYAFDICMGGVGIGVPDSVSAADLGREVDVVITLPGHKPFMTKGKLAHRTDRAGRSKFGVEFTDLQADHRDSLKAYVERMLRLGMRS